MLNIFIQETAGLATQKAYTQIQRSEEVKVNQDKTDFKW
jgi:hypothetical protein